MRPSRWGAPRFSSTLTIIFLVIVGLVSFLPATPTYACYTWSVGSRVGLRKGGELRTGPGIGYRAHTVVPEDNWQVDIINGPRSADGQQWWDTSRRNIDGGGTGWVSIQQAGFDVCGPSQPAPQPPSQPAPPPPAPGSSGGIELCEHVEGTGVCETFNGDDADLRDNAIGNDRASLVTVPSGRLVALYEHVGFEGKCQDFASSSSLVGSYIGNDNVSSLRVDKPCVSQPSQPQPNPTSPPQPQPAPPPSTFKLCKHIEEVECQNFNNDIADLRNSQVGNDEATLLIVPPGQVATIYEHAYFTGRCQFLGAGRHDLGRTFVGNDNLTSIKVSKECYAPNNPNIQWGWCADIPSVYDQGGGSIDDQNYYLELQHPIIFGNDNARVSYNGQWFHPKPGEIASWAGYFDGVNRYGVSTKWAYANPGWDDDARWRIEHPC